MELFGMFRKMPNDPSLKAAILIYELDMRFNKAGLTSLPATLKEVISLNGFGVCVSRKNFFMTLNHKVMNSLISGGIPQYLIDFYTKFDLRPILIPEKDPKVFDVDDLMFGFIIWLVACGVSITVFIIEVTFYHLRIFVGKVLLFNYIKSRKKI